jgi:hypothetical protein
MRVVWRPRRDTTNVSMTSHIAHRSHPLSGEPQVAVNAGSGSDVLRPSDGTGRDDAGRLSADSVATAGAIGGRVSTCGMAALWAPDVGRGDVEDAHRAPVTGAPDSWTRASFWPDHRRAHRQLRPRSAVRNVHDLVSGRPTTRRETETPAYDRATSLREIGLVHRGWIRSHRRCTQGLTEGSLWGRVVAASAHH